MCTVIPSAHNVQVKEQQDMTRLWFLVLMLHVNVHYCKQVFISIYARTKYTKHYQQMDNRRYKSLNWIRLDQMSCVKQLNIFTSNNFR